MSNPSKSLYSAAVSSREIPGAFHASFALPGEPPAWVMENGQKKLFISAEAAELAGWRIIASKLNKAHDVQTFLVKRAQKQAEQIKSYHAPDKKAPTAEADRVFSRFK